MAELLALFSAHPASVGETYWSHLWRAGLTGVRLVIAGLACFIHALLPFLFVHTASRIVTTLHADLQARRPVQTGTPASVATLTAE